jgi:hypothetical protein
VERLRRATFVLVLAVAAAVPTAAAAASSSPEQQLADKYAPIIALKDQTKPCDTKGEPYRPVQAGVVLGRPDVRLVDSNGNVIAIAPTATDLFGAGENTYLDLPGNPLNPGCTYEKWAREIAVGTPTTAYAHVVTEAGKPGKLALQYWFYYPFNDFNNKHESDWETIQLMFDAGSAADALKTSPTEVGYSQHSGAERAAWDGTKLEKQGTHPVVYAAAGSHASFFKQTLWLGASAQEGFGCDDTRGPSTKTQTTAVLLPAAPASATAPYAWLAFKGHWGQKESGPNNGPTGPNMKTQWTEPVTWADDTWRSGSTEVPGTNTFGPSATSFFCAAVAKGSQVYLRFLRTPWLVLGIITAIALLGVWLSRRTRWSPHEPLPIDQIRSGGQIYRAAWRLYRRYAPLFLGIGVIFIPLSVVTAIVQGIVFKYTGLGTLVDEASADPIVAGAIALLFGELSTIVATVLVTGAAAEALDRIDGGDHVDAVTAYRGIAPNLVSLGWAWLRIIVVASVLTLTVIGIPVAVFYLVRKAVTTQACVVEELGASASLRRSSEVIKRRELRVFAITALVNVTAFLLGPIVGVLFLFLTSSSLAVIDIIGSLVYAVVMPYAGIAIALLFYDLRRRHEEAPAVSPSAIPAPTASH